jgi:hypothetical protein
MSQGVLRMRFERGRFDKVTRLSDQGFWKCFEVSVDLLEQERKLMVICKSFLNEAENLNITLSQSLRSEVSVNV